MNIVDIKKRIKSLQEARKEAWNAPTPDFKTTTGISNNILNERYQTQLKLVGHFAEADIKYLLSIIDLVEQDLTYMKQYGELTNLDGKMKLCIERALQTLSKGG